MSGELVSGVLSMDPEGKIIAFDECYQGYFSRGWLTVMEPREAFDALQKSGISSSMGDDLEVEGDPDDGNWGVSTPEGTFYYEIFPEGPKIGFIGPDGSEELVSRWRSLTDNNSSPDRLIGY